MQYQKLLMFLLAASVYQSLALHGGNQHLCESSKQLLGGFQVLDATQCSTNRALGYAIGKEFRDSITGRLAALGPKLDKTVAFAKSESGSRAIASLTKASQTAYPQYWEELEGIADGSGIPKELIVLLNFRQEVSTLLAGNDSSIADDCSDVLLRLPSRGNSDDLAFLGHNEDNTPDTVNTTYFVQAKLNGRSWTAYTYAGELSSAAWGFSDAGVSFTLNAVFPTDVEVTGVGRNFVSRSILDAPSLEAAVEAITVKNQATGHNINLLGLDSVRILTIETGPGNSSSVMEISNGSYFHANSYLRLDVPQIAGASSRHREARAVELGAPSSRQDILAILGDTQDTEYPIYRTGSSPDSIYTLCTAFFDLHAETVEVFFSNPKDSEDPSAVRGLRLCLGKPEEEAAMVNAMDGWDNHVQQAFGSAAWIVGIAAVVLGSAGVALASRMRGARPEDEAPTVQQELLSRPGFAGEPLLAEKDFSQHCGSWLLEPAGWPAARL